MPQPTQEEVVEGSQLIADLPTRQIDQDAREEQRLHTLRHVPYLIFAFLFVLEIGVYAMSVPVMRMLESILCRKYFLQHDPSRVVNGMVNEQYCKISAIQKPLDELIGLDSAAGLVPGLFLSIFYANLMDTWGRRRVFILCFVGIDIGVLWQLMIIILSDTVALKWWVLGNFFSFIGGGAAVAVLSLSTIMADVTDPASRSKMFLYFSASALIASTVGVPIGTQMMKFSLWLPLFFGTGILVLSTICCFFVPETSPAAYYARLDKLEGLEHAADAPAADETQPLLPRPDAEANGDKSSDFWLSLRRVLPLYFFEAPWRIKLLCSAFFAVNFGRFAFSFLAPYISVRFHISLGTAGWYITLYNLSTLVCLMVILPSINKFFTKRMGLIAVESDLIMARLTIIALVLGTLAIALAPVHGIMAAAVITSTVGGGFAPAVRGLATGLCSQEDVAKMFGVIAIFETLGGIASGWGLSYTLEIGQRLGGMLTGLTYLIASCTFALVAIIIFCVRLPKIMPADAEDG